jgi:hypothetical protein
MEFEIATLRDTVSIAMLASFAGLFLPYLIALINHPKLKPQIRGLIALLIYGATGVVIAWWQGSLDNATDLAAAIVPVFMVSMTKYQFLDKPSLIAPKLEYLTSRRNFDMYAEDKLARDPKPIVVEAPGGDETVIKTEP